ncbi:MAG: prolyl-tRNA synthetase associated domain-containing protein, partial [Devosiaceae bacterium]|nr:prolyl-tRNA synthetase associated domain-containing protein [Devosiaceae bacterium MH13]
VFTVEQSQHIHRQIEGAHTKNLFLKDKKGTLFLVTAAHGTQVDLKTLGCGRLSFGKGELLEATLGVTPGSVTAFAIINDTDKAVRFVLDANLLAADTINGHPMQNTATTSIARDDLFAFVERTGHAVEVIDLEGPAPD